MIRRLHLFDGGRVRHLERLVRRDGAWRTRTLPARFAALEHADGRLWLFDTGYHPALRTALTGAARAYHRLVPWQAPLSTAEALSSRGLDPATVEVVVLSHLHADHVAGLVDFPGARIRLTRTALDHLHALDPLTRLRQGYFPELLPADLEARLDPLPEPPPARRLADSAAPLMEGVDVVSLPGHAAGQVGLWVRPTEDRAALLVGDAVFSLGGLRAGVLPSRLFRAVVFHDDAATRATHDRIRAWWEAAPDLRIIPAHAWVVC